MRIFQGKKRTLLILLSKLFVGFCGGVLAQKVGIPREVKNYVLDTLAEIRKEPTRAPEWKRYPSNPVLSPTKNSWDSMLTGYASVLKDEDGYKLHYTGQRTAKDHQIGLATSFDGKSWQKCKINPILKPGAPGSWDDWVVWCPMVWKEGSTYHMLYSGADTANIKQVGYAYSSDGINWTKHNNNPVFNEPNPWAHNKTEGWGIIKADDTYHMYYCSLGGSDRRQIGLATSTDLVSWTAYQNTPIFATGCGYNWAQYCPWPFKYNGHYYLVVTSHSARKDHRFKLYRSPDPLFLPERRAFVGFILKTHSEIPWETYGYLDTPCILADDITMSTFPKDELWMYYTAATVFNRKDNQNHVHIGLAIQNMDKLLPSEYRNN